MFGLSHCMEDPIEFHTVVYCRQVHNIFLALQRKCQSFCMLANANKPILMDKHRHSISKAVIEIKQDSTSFGSSSFRQYSLTLNI